MGRYLAPPRPGLETLVPKLEGQQDCSVLPSPRGLVHVEDTILTPSFRGQPSVLPLSFQTPPCSDGTMVVT